MKRINQRENTIEQPRVVEQQYVAQLKNAVGQATDILRSGGVLLYPTDTVWGLGCDAANSRAVNKIIPLSHRHRLGLGLRRRQQPSGQQNYPTQGTFPKPKFHRACS